MTFSRIVTQAKDVNDAKEEDLKHNHVAIILRKGKPVAIGHNKAKSHPATRKYPYGKHENIHAELDACIKLGKTDCRNYTMVVMRIRKNGNLANSKPCLGCQHVLAQLNFKQVYYSTNSGKFISL